jgi:hypothetical protein
MPAVVVDTHAITWYLATGLASYVPDRYTWLTPFDRLYDLVRMARNDAMHQEASVPGHCACIHPIGLLEEQWTRRRSRNTWPRDSDAKNTGPPQCRREP